MCMYVSSLYTILVLNKNDHFIYPGDKEIILVLNQNSIYDSKYTEIWICKLYYSLGTNRVMIWYTCVELTKLWSSILILDHNLDRATDPFTFYADRWFAINNNIC